MNSFDLGFVWWKTWVLIPVLSGCLFYTAIIFLLTWGIVRITGPIGWKVTTSGFFLIWLGMVPLSMIAGIPGGNLSGEFKLMTVFIQVIAWPYLIFGRMYFNRKKAAA